MKKILFLLLVCFIKLNAWELILSNSNVHLPNIYYFTLKIDAHQVYYYSYNSQGSLNNATPLILNVLSQIKRNVNTNYISNNEFVNAYKSNLEILNDLYLKCYNNNYFLNYLYNENYFNNNEFIKYENYQILYNADGLAVESIVNEKWAGLYDDSGQSGYLYDQKGGLLYVNGVSASFFDRINEKLLRKFKINLESIFIKKIFYPLLVLIFACVILRSVIRMAFQAFLIRFYDKKISQLEKRREKIENA